MADEHAVFAKCALRLIPFLMLLFLVNFLDRVNVGFAALTMNRDLGFSPATYGFAAGVFFIGYFVCEVPSNIVLARVGARLWLFRIMLSWGVLSGASALIQGAASFYVLRFLLGVAEAGFFPGVIYYLTLWFPAAYRARFVAAFISAGALATVIGAPLSGAILGWDGVLSLRGWQWLFLVEGVPALLLAFAVLWRLPDGPHQARWISPDERAVLAQALSAGEPAQERALWPALRDSRVLLLSLALFGIQSGLFGLGLWLPQMVQAIGYSNAATGWLVAPPYLLSIVAMIWWGRASDRNGERVWHVAIPAVVAAAALVLAALLQTGPLVLIALSVAVIAVYATLGPFWGLPSAFLGGEAAAGGIALVNAIGSLGGFVAPSAIGFFRQQTGDYAGGLFVMAAGLLASAVIVLGLARVLPRPHLAVPAR